MKIGKALAAAMLLPLAGCTSTLDMMGGGLDVAGGQVEEVAQRVGQRVDTLNAWSLYQLCEGTSMAGYQRLAPEIREKLDALCIARGGPWVAPGAAAVK